MTGMVAPAWMHEQVTAEQYATWVGRFVTGDFGRSHYLKLGVGVHFYYAQVFYQLTKFHIFLL